MCTTRSRVFRWLAVAALVAAGFQTRHAVSAEAPLLLQHPSLSATTIAFDYAGEIWIVPREGGTARRLVSGLGQLSRPFFSTDGSLIAYTGVYDGNTDVYVVSASGGEPRRLTYHPGEDVGLGFAPDGKSVLIRSPRASYRDLSQLYTVPVTGGQPVPVPLPSGEQASYSPDGSRLAYVPHGQWQPAWKKYRGGQTTPVWIANLQDSTITQVPRTGSNDRNPMWVGETVYFLSDRNGPFTLFAYEVSSGTVTEVVPNVDGFDVQSAAAGPGAIVYDQFGALQVFDLATRQSRRVAVSLSADLPQVRPRFQKVGGDDILHAAISATGKRVLLEAHGEILSVPAEKGDVRNLTRSPGVADRDPAWSPDGKSVAYFSDESGEYALHIRAADGLGTVTKINLGVPPSFFYSPRFSPDGRKIAYSDKRMNLWIADLATKKLTRVDTDRFDTPLQNLDSAWSPDSRWLAYTKQLPNFLRAVFVYSLEDGRVHQVTDGRSDAISPRFDKDGKALYFIGSTSVGLAQGWIDMSSLARPVTSSVYAAVLRKDLPSPVAPESDEAIEDDKKPDDAADEKEKADTAGKKASKPPKPVRIDFEGLDQRIVALPIDRANYSMLEIGSDGTLLLAANPVVLADEDYVELQELPPQDVYRYDAKKRKAEKLFEKIDGGSAAYGGRVTFLVLADGSKVLYMKGKKWFIGTPDSPDKAGEPGKEGEGELKGDIEVFVDPRAEWSQMYREVWRIERDFFYAPNFHGLDLTAAEAAYEVFLPGIASRQDLTALCVEMTGNLVVGHVFIGGGSLPKQEAVTVGLLGADYRVVDGRYQIARILRGENWNPTVAAPHTQPGVSVKEGEFLLAVNGQELRGDDDVFRLFQGTAEKQTVLTIGPKADGSGSRQVTVVPVPSEDGLRLRSWMESNRRLVDERSAGRVAYVYVPDTYAEGFANFNRYFFSQVDKDALIIDERFNHGGNIADYIIDYLRRIPQWGNAGREGDDQISPMGGIYGPKVMIINQMSGSGGDALPWMFRHAKLGPLVGTRTWGGLVGIGGYPRLIDGGFVMAPRWGLYSVDGNWAVENVGVPPDIEVEQDPALVRRGQDPQLDKAIQVALDLLAKNPPSKLTRPPYPDYKTRVPTRQ